MIRDKAAEFYKLSEAYCQYIVEDIITLDSVPTVIEFLMRLYVSAMNLPEAETDTIESPNRFHNSISIEFSDQVPTLYWMMFDPYEEDDLVSGSLKEDLTSIVEDLRNGMLEYEGDSIENAVFEWKLGFKSHWGQHAIDALKALHALMI